MTASTITRVETTHALENRAESILVVVGRDAGGAILDVEIEDQQAGCATVPVECLPALSDLLRELVAEGTTK